jgi:protein-S-isoprenylcysteine O-methyltransferase Ste14
VSGALAAVAGRLAARPGMHRWIGPDDGVVVAQAAALAALAWPGRARWHLPAAVRATAAAALVVGGGLAVAAGGTHGARLTPRVEPPDDAELFTAGPYARSRNPIYAGLLVASAGWAVLRRRPEPLLAWAALLAVLTRKTRHEEVRLAERFGTTYEEYRRRTPRFVGVRSLRPEA